MQVAHVTTTTTVILPDQGTQEFNSVYADWYEAEGKYMQEDGLPMPEGDALMDTLAVYITVASQVGNMLNYISSQDTQVTRP